MDRSRSAKFIVLDAAKLGTSRLRAVLARYKGVDMEVVEARDFAEARTIAGRPDSAPQAAFVTYDAGSDADGSALSTLVQLGTQLPIVFVTRDGDDLASRRLGRTATVAELPLSAVDAESARRAIAYARGAFERWRDELNLRKSALDATRAHDKLASSHATLERWAAELEIANARLREVDDLKTKFLSEVSHEIRTPLAAVVSAAKIIMKHHLTKPDVVPRFGNTILVEGDRLTRLLNEFLDLTKIEAGCVDWHDSDLKVESLAEDAIAGMAAMADERGIELLADVQPDLPAIVVDRDRVIQVLNNLLMNAIKYTPKGGTIVLRAILDEGDTILFEVSDTGPGIAREELGKVFDRFHQVRRSDDRENGRKGTGLGLCICREIVDHYGGRIWVESEVGQGSTFKFTLPRATTARLVRAPKLEKRHGGHAVRVLVLTDDVGLAERVMGHRDIPDIDWTVATSPNDAIDVLSSRRTDVVIVSKAILDAQEDDLLSRVQSYGVSHVLLMSPEHGLVEAGVLESSDAIARSLAAIAPRGSRVMVVEDDDHYRGLLEFQLTEDGYDVAAFDNGRDALDAVATFAPDLAVLDLIMPGLDGLTVLERLKAIDPLLPAVVLTAMDDPSVAVAARELGAVGVFRKDTPDAQPYRTVVARVRRVMSEMTGRTQVEARPS
jgi:signal transduction histidine kinase/CheY-like chemotaxis protein